MLGPSDPSPLASALLAQVRHYVRSRFRSPDYYRAGDAFSNTYLGKTFQVEPDIYRAVGTDCSAIDWLYEELGQSEILTRPVLDAATQALQEMTRPGPARAALEPLTAALQWPTCSLLDVCRALLCAITVRGEDTLVARGCPPALVQRWLTLWSDRVWRQNSQQARLALLVQAMREPLEARRARATLLGVGEDLEHVPGPSFTRGVHDYLELYAETGASSVALVGGLPSAQALSPPELERMLNLLGEDSDLLGEVARLLRFAQDVRFDPTEFINSGVLGYAAEHQQPLVRLDTARLPRAELDARLARQWEEDSPRARQRLDALVASVGDGDEDAPLRRLLEGFVVAVCAVATRLAEAGHEPPPGG